MKIIFFWQQNIGTLAVGSCEYCIDEYTLQYTMYYVQDLYFEHIVHVVLEHL